VSHFYSGNTWWWSIIPKHVVFLCFNIITDNTESVSYLLNQHIACVRLNRYILIFTLWLYEVMTASSIGGSYWLSRGPCRFSFQGPLYIEVVSIILNRKMNKLKFKMASLSPKGHSSGRSQNHMQANSFETV
jgi:hypothetical protein